MFNKMKQPITITFKVETTAETKYESSHNKTLWSEGLYFFHVPKETSGNFTNKCGWPHKAEHVCFFRTARDSEGSSRSIAGISWRWDTARMDSAGSLVGASEIKSKLQQQQLMVVFCTWGRFMPFSTCVCYTCFTLENKKTFSAIRENVFHSIVSKTIPPFSLYPTNSWKQNTLKLNSRGDFLCYVVPSVLGI